MRTPNPLVLTLAVSAALALILIARRPTQTEPIRVGIVHALSVGRTSLNGPSGIVALDAATRHLWRRVYVGHARADGQFDAVEISEAPIRPVPFPASRSRAEWHALVDRLSGETNRSLPRDSR
jgi:hypothetical protein